MSVLSGFPKFAMTPNNLYNKYHYPRLTKEKGWWRLSNLLKSSQLVGAESGLEPGFPASETRFFAIPLCHRTQCQVLTRDSSFARLCPGEAII